VAAAAQQLPVNCLYSLSARHLELLHEEGQHVECLQVRFVFYIALFGRY
jgi:hypothetical protein